MVRTEGMITASLRFGSGVDFKWNWLLFSCEACVSKAAARGGIECTLGSRGHLMNSSILNQRLYIGHHDLALLPMILMDKL